MNMQHNSLPNICETTWQGTSRTSLDDNNLGTRDYLFNFNLIHWTGCKSIEFSRFSSRGGPKEKVSIEDPTDVVHENPYATLQHALTSFMALVALKEHVRGVSWTRMKVVTWNVTGACSPHKKYMLWETLLSRECDILCAIEHKCL